MKLKQIFSVAAACTLAAAAVAADAAAPKRVLVFSKCEGFNHRASIAACKEKMAEEAKKGAFAVDFSDDYAALKIENLAQYDALVLNNTTCLKTKDNPHVAPAICSYVRWGGGLCVIHAGADNFYDAPECSHLVGGRFDGHPWFSNGTWAFKVEDRESPLTAPFKRFADGKFKRSDEIYQQSSPFYDRSKLHVLISLDLSDPVTAGRKGQKRADKDYAVSWIRRYGKGRVFYTTFAHDDRAWKAADTRAHIFAGLAYTLGTLKADDTPAGAKCCKERKCCKAKTCCAFYVPSLEACAADVLDKPYTGVDGRVRDARAARLGAAFGRAVEKGEAKAAAPLARRVFEKRDLPETLRATAARVLLAADPATFGEVIADPAKKVRQAVFGRGLSIPPVAFAKALPGATPCLQRAIIAHLVQTGATCCKKAVVDAMSASDEETATAAVAALGTLGGPEEVPLLCKLRTRGGAVGAAAEEALAEIPGAGDAIFNLAATDKGVLAVAAKRAETKLLPRWKAFIQSDDPAVRKAAWRALGKMASDETDDCVFTWFTGVKGEEAAAAASVVWSSVKSQKAAARAERIVDLWKKGSPAARAEAEELLVRANGLAALDAWQALADDAAYGKAAKAAYVALAKKVASGDVAAKATPKSEWKGSASKSLGGDQPQKAYDGNDGTRWTSGHHSKGVWYAIDFGSRIFVESVTLDTTKSPRDTPAGCDVFASDDGKTWQGPVATCDDKTEKTTTFAVGRATRHLKFVARDTRPGLHWSIHEINVKAGMDAGRREQIRKTAETYEKEAK